MKNYIKVERARKDITQVQLADKIKVLRQTINAIEKGMFVPSTLLTLKMAHYFECNVEDIFQLDELDISGGFGGIV